MIADILTRLLIPVARLSVANGLGVRDLTDPLKRAFLIVAQEQGGEDRLTDSRLSVLTGLQRRDVVRLRDLAPSAPAPSAPARVLRDWPDGTTRLPRMGEGPSFETLARSIRQDIHPRTLLDLLVDAGAVRLDGDEVHLIRRDYLPATGSPEQMAYLADNLHDHGLAAVENVTRGAGHFDRAAHFTGLRPADAARLAARHRDLTAEALNRIAHEAKGMDGGGEIRVRFGAYAYTEPTPNPEPEEGRE